MKIKRIAHIGIAVKDVDEVKKVYTEGLDLSFGGEDRLGELKIGFVPVGETNLELVQSTDPEGVMAKFIAKKGEGIHHIAFEVEDIESAVKELLDKGVQMIDKAPRPGAHGSKVAFLHPKATHGVLLELVEYPRESHK